MPRFGRYLEYTIAGTPAQHMISVYPQPRKGNNRKATTGENTVRSVMKEERWHKLYGHKKRLRKNVETTSQTKSVSPIL